MNNLTVQDLQSLFCEVLKDLLPSLRRYTDKQIVTKIGVAKFEEAVDQVTDYLETSCGEITSRIEYTALATKVFKCLSVYLTKIDVPTTINTLVNNIHLLPHAVDKAFPGYASSKFLKSIIQPNNFEQLKRITLVA